jgi:Fe2+ or Zn2+ uptake regulation protein/O6-methylguanine-DNA--protein-cysteine methyltransferase
MDGDADLRELLRARGLRVTSQRRAILSVFSAAAAEHLSADEIHARAAAILPEIGRGTVYSTLAELTELGVLAARGSPEPVRYETNTAPHHHFRCRLCLRTFDVALPEPDTSGLTRAGFVTEHVDMTADGVCEECVDYDRGLRAGARRARGQATLALPERVAAAAMDTPVGTVTLGATPDGLVRAVFDDHADAPALRATIRDRRGNQHARAHLAAAKVAVNAYFDGGAVGEHMIDWPQLDRVRTLQAVRTIGRGEDASYEALDTDAGPRERGETLGANPLALFVPCHRVTRGREIPSEYVGGQQRRLALLGLERP